MPRERLYGSKKEAYRPLDSLDESAYSGENASFTPSSFDAPVLTCSFGIHGRCP